MPDKQTELDVQTLFNEGAGTAFFKKQTGLVGCFSGGLTNVHARQLALPSHAAAHWSGFATKTLAISLPKKS